MVFTQPIPSMPSIKAHLSSHSYSNSAEITCNFARNMSDVRESISGIMGTDRLVIIIVAARTACGGGEIPARFIMANYSGCMNLMM